MRTYEEMMKLIMDKAKSDERIRAVTMEGSRVNPDSIRDQYSDFDICYYVTDIREFTRDKAWIEYFGDILIVQCPEDWYSHGYDYNGRERFAYLIQFRDGNRIDLSLIDVSRISDERKNDEPRIVLMNKDNFDALIPIDHNKAFYINKPTEKEYFDTCNEFRWLSIYITKGLCRHELYYAKHAYDVLLMEMFIKMLNWKIAVDYDFKISTGGSSKYIKRYLSAEEMKKFAGVFPNGDYADIWTKLFLIYDYFAENAEYVAIKLGFYFDSYETDSVRDFLILRKGDYELMEE